ncbi:unnamed protein product, partial [Ectocarpus fasciculatus]
MVQRMGRCVVYPFFCSSSSSSSTMQSILKARLPTAVCRCCHATLTLTGNQHSGAKGRYICPANPFREVRLGGLLFRWKKQVSKKNMCIRTTACTSSSYINLYLRSP